MISSKRTPRSTRAQMRILEAVVAAGIIFLVFSVAAFLTNTSSVTVLPERENLDRLGYDVLSRLTESRIIEGTLETNSTDQTLQLKNFVQTILPSATYFKLTVTSCSYNATTQWIQLSNLVSVRNTDDSSFASSLEVSSTPMIYTSRSGNIYYLALLLARAGGGS